MRNLMKIAVLGAGVVSGSAAIADEPCFVPMADWQPRPAVREWAEAQGWSVRRIKADDGCYEVYAADENGRGIEVRVSPRDLSVVNVEYESHLDSDDGQD